MGKIAFVFSGQGDQYSGMGKDLYENYKSAKSVFDICDEIRPGTINQCFYGTEDELKQTKNTQSCLFAYELACLSVLKEKGTRADGVAGFSLGEVSAMTACGVFDLSTGFELVTRRGEIMQDEAEKHDTFMAAILKLSPEKLQGICEQYEDIYAVNFNCPGQITVSGLSAHKDDFFNAVKDEGGRALPLKVRGAFHSPFMKNAASEFEAVIKKTEKNEPAIPIYSNVTAKPYGEDITKLLSMQICSPVKWEELICNMIADGFDTFVEIGPGRTLTNMIKKINTNITAKTVLECLEEVQGA